MTNQSNPSNPSNPSDPANPANPTNPVSMPKRLSLSVGSVLTLAVLLLAVLGAYAIGAGRSDATPTVAPTAAPFQTGARTMVMQGTGEVTGVPNQMAFDLSVQAKAVDVAAALDQANARMRRVLGALADLDVASKDVQTTGLSIDPEYRYYNNAPPVLTGYRVTERAEVLVRRLADGGKAVSAAVGAAGNAVRVSDVRLRLGGQGALLEKARDEAVGEARTKAEQYAAAAGQSLGDVVSLREVRLSTPLPYDGERVLYDEATAKIPSAVPIRAGSEKVKVTVSVVWSLG